MVFRSNWRGPEEWIGENLPITSTTSAEATKLFDCALTQLVGWYDDAQQEKGLAGTLHRMIEADPDFVLGRALSVGIDLIGTGVTVRRNEMLERDLRDLRQSAERRKSEIEWREWAHVQAIDRFASGKMREAAQWWEDILLRHPTDMMALKMAHDTYFYLGAKTEIRDSIARVLPTWNVKQPPLSCYIHGMYAFGLEETQFYAKAEEQAKLGLEKQPYDSWAVHALAHVYEMATKPVQGLGFLSRTVPQWDRCNFLACHNYWHWALFHMEQDEPEAAAELLDKKILAAANTSGAMLDLVDACSLLFRLRLLHPDSANATTAEQWKAVYRLAEPHLDDHILGFNDAHFAMACIGAGEDRSIDRLREGIESVRSTDAVSDHWLDVTSTILEAMSDFGREQYHRTVEKLFRVKADIVKIGGSDAQRDVFNQLLIVAACRAGNRDMCRALLAERRALKGDDVVVRQIDRSLSSPST